MNTHTYLGFASLIISLGIILGLYVLFVELGNGRYLHFRRFFALQAAAYGAASASVLLDSSLLLAGARILTPISYAVLFWGMTRDETL